MMKLIYIFIFIILLAGMISCYHSPYLSIESDELVRQAEEYLIETIDSLMEIDPQEEPDRYLGARIIFEEAVQQYLLLTGREDRSVVHLDYKGTNIIIPMRNVELFGDIRGLERHPGAQIFWQRIGPVFEDDVIDVAAVEIDEGDVKIAALFADSLVLLSPREDEDIRTYRIPQQYNRDIRAKFPAGLMTTDERRIYFTTTQSDTSFLLDLESRPGSILAHNYPLEVKSLAGKPYFEFSFNSESDDIFGIRSEDIGLLVLDNAGIPKMLSREEGSVIWQADRSWGNRLFKLGRGAYAITHPEDRTFTVFTLLQDTIIAYGTSPQFHGDVGSVGLAELSDRNGFIVSIRTGNETNSEKYSQLYFMPHDLIRWRDAETVPPPLFPDYDSDLILIDNISHMIEAGTLHREHQSFKNNNVYETLLVRGEDGELVNNIALSVNPEEGYRHWIIRLKPEIRFSDGIPLDAALVKESWERNFRKCDEIACIMSWISNDVFDIIVIDTLTIQVMLRDSRPNFPEHLLTPCFEIGKVSEGHQWELGTGPFMISDMNRDRIRYTRNPYYHGGFPALREITVLTRRTNVIDFVTERPNAGAMIRHPRDIDFFRAIDNLKSVEGYIDKIYFVALNPESPGMESAGGRARVLGSINRQAILTVVTEAKSEIAESFFTGGELPIAQQPGGNQSRSPNPLLIVYHSGDPVSEQIAQRLAVRLQQERINVRRPEGLSLERLNQVRRNRQYDILVDSFLPFFARPEYNMYDLLQRGFLFDEYLKESVEDLLKADTDIDVKAIEQYIADQSYLYPLVRASFHTVVPRRLHDINYTGRVMLDFSRAWVPR